VLELRGLIVYLREYTAPEKLRRYASLSHCWGPEGPAIRLTHDTIEQLKDGFSISKLPKTFRDAVKVCQNLGISYLWVDALCKFSCKHHTHHTPKFDHLGILQDDKKDWKQAAATMADTYQNAYLTIAASHSRDSNGGLFASTPILSKRLPNHQQFYVIQRLRFPKSYPDT
jgi:hypothetical protein